MKKFVLILLIINSLQLWANLDRGFLSQNIPYYTLEQRLEIIENLWEATYNQYALWDIKKETIRVDGNEVFEKALEEEKLFQNQTDLITKAKGNLDFIDRMRKLVATFQDTHFGLSPILRVPYIFNGLVLQEVDNNYYIVGLRPKILEYNYKQGYQNQAYKNLSIGDKIISIDGQPVSKHIEELLPYKDGSSEAYRKDMAAYYLTRRNFRYPNKSYNDYEISSKYGKTYKVRLPWYYFLSTNRKDAILYFNSIGIKQVNDLSLKWSNKNMAWETVELEDRKGYSAIKTPVHLKNVNTWLAKDNNSEIIRTGHLFKRGKAYGVLQLFSYSTFGVKKDDEESNIFEVITNFVNELKEAKLPLIFDLRYNGGGNGRYPAIVMSLIAKANEKYPNTTKAYRLTDYMINILELSDKHRDVNYFEDYNLWIQVVSDLDYYFENGMTHTYAYSRDKEIVADPAVNGYEEPIVALISPHCISACDNQANIFKASKRVTLLGTHSNGTGAGYQSYSPFISESYKDNLYFSIKTHIPKYLFGKPGIIGQYVYQNERAYIEMNSENNPTVADIEYHPTLNDYINHSEDWYNKAIEVIDSQQD